MKLEYPLDYYMSESIRKIFIQGQRDIPLESNFHIMIKKIPRIINYEVLNIKLKTNKNQNKLKIPIKIINKKKYLDFTEIK